MKIIKPMTLGVLNRPYPFLGRHRMVVAALGFFRLGVEQERLLDEHQQWAAVLPLLPQGVPLDEVMPKLRGEALVLGRAWAPDAKPVAAMCVRLRIGAIDKTLRVIGARGWRRQWRYGVMADYRVDPPQPFLSMPLDAAHAYGGPGHPANPLGTGYAGPLGLRLAHGAMPNIELAGAPVRAHWRRLDPAGFGPIPAHWAPRAGRYGTYGQRWLRDEAPGFASDIDWSVFNLAPDDQRLPGLFSGGEAYRLEGMHPHKPVIEGTLPRLRARAFLLAHGDAPSACREVAMKLDTVWFIPERELGVMVFHGELDIADSDGLDIATLMAGYEHQEQEKPLAHYHQVLAWRGDTATATLHAFDESQLTPAWSAATEAARAAADQADRAAELARRQQVLDQLDSEHWQRMGTPPPPGHQPPQAEPMGSGELTPAAIASGDFSLTGMVEAAQARLADVRREGDAKRARLKAEPAIARMLAAAAHPDPQQQFEAALQRAIVPAYDLFPAEQTGRDPAVAEQIAQLDRAYADGLLTAGRHQQARSAIDQAPAIKRRARRAAPRHTGAALSAPAAGRLGMQVRQWLQDGIALAGRDLAGADLRGVVLDGADLREVMLERADLRGASLRNADLRCAVLTEARLAGADLRGARLEQANLSHSDAQGARLAGATLRQAQLVGAIWRNADLSGANLDQAVAMRIDLGGAVLDRVHANGTVMLEASADDSRWHGAQLELVVALRASLVRADFSGAQLISCAVIEADLSGSNWRGATWRQLQGAAAGTDWRGAMLRGLRAEDCGLHGACFSGADMEAAHFLRCDLGGCLLDGARLARAHFPHSNLMAAQLHGADLSGADFYQAICRKADFTEAKLDAARFVQAEMTGVRLPQPECRA
jgi:uncharacterized protein YjbI with pentapeptide repeats